MARYSRIPITKDDTGTRLYKTVKYPIIPRRENDIYVITTQGDRFDTLAQQFDKDSSLWWIISIANTDKLNQSTLIIPPGIQIRIPANYNSIIGNFNLINS